MDYFSSGTKKEKKKKLGIEVEHFIVYSDSLQAVSYYGEYGVKYILEQLMKIYESPKPIFDEDLIGFLANDFSITLEPSAQIEISVNPFESIEKIEFIYKKFLETIQRVLKKINCIILPVGVQPFSTVKSLSLIPKKRYRFMENYFENIDDSKGIYMMKGTCSTQVSIDYFSENDFRRKFQAAYLFTPVFGLITNNSEYFEGKKLKTFLKRAQIYDNTDPIRCSAPKKIFSLDFGFKDYAKYLSKVPPIFVENTNGKHVYTGKQIAEDIFKGRKVNNNNILHMISIVFPDVRLKNYIEIRGADSMPLSGITAYCALIKGLIYSENALNWCQNFIKENEITVENLNETKKNLIDLGWEGEIYNISAKKFVEEVIKLADCGLKPKEKKYLDPFKKCLN